MKHGLEYTMEYFVKALMSNDSYDIKPSTHWADDEWFIDQEKRNFIKNEGYLVLQEGSAEGTNCRRKPNTSATGYSIFPRYSQQHLVF